MIHISKFVFILLIFSISCKEESINLDIGSEVKKTLIETEEPIYYHIKLNEELKSGYIKIETNSDYQQGPAYIVFSKENLPERSNALLVADSISSIDNLLYINKEYIKNNQLNIKIGCHVKSCLFNVTFSNTEYIEIKRDSSYTYLTGNENKNNIFKISRKNEEQSLGNGNQNATMIFSINSPNNYLSARLFCVNSNNKTEISKLIKNFQKGLIMTFKENDNCEYHEDAYYLIDINSTDGDYIIFNSRSIESKTDNRIIPNSPALDSYLKEGVLEEECFDVTPTIPQPKGFYVINILTFSNPLNVTLKDPVTLKDEEIGIVYYEEAIKITYEFGNKRHICVKGLNNKEAVFNMQITDTNVELLRKDFYSPQISSYIYTRIIQEDSIVFFTHKKFKNYYKQLNMNMKLIKGLPEMYFTTCQNFPECKYNVGEIDDYINKGIFIKPHSVNGMYTYSISPDKDYSIINSNQTLLVVHCKKGDECIFETSFFDDTDSLILKKDSRFSNYLNANDTNKFSFEITDHKATKVIFTLYTLSGNTELILKKAPKGTDNDFTMNINKQEFIFTDKTIERSILGGYEFEIHGKSNAYYSIEYKIISRASLNENILDSGISYLEKIPFNDKKINFYIKHNRIGKNINFVSTFFGVNCKIKVEREEKEVQQKGTLIQDDISFNDKDYNLTRFEYIVKIVEMDNIQSINEDCMVYISSIEMDVSSENEYDKEIVIPENIQQQILLNEKTRGIKFLYPLSETEGNVLLNFIIIQNSPLNVSISYESNKKKYEYYVANSQTILLQKDIIRGENNCNQKNQVCNIIINIIPVNESDLSQGILFALSAKSKEIIPIYIKKTIMKEDSLSGNEIEYYYTDIIKDEEGEIIVNFDRGNGNIFARIYDKNSTDNNSDWMGKIHLPKPNDNDILKTDPYLKKVLYSKEDSSKCNKGCYLIIGVQNMIHSETENEKFLYDISIMIYILSKNEKRQITSIPIDKYIIHSLPQNEILDDYYKYYSLYVPSEAKELIIEFQSELCDMYVKDGNQIPSKKDYDYKFTPNSSGASIFKIKRREGSTLKGRTFTFAVGTSKAKVLFTSLYTFRLRLPNENYNELILVQSDQKAICDIENNNELCFFMIPLREYHDIDYIYVHAYSNVNTDIVFYFNQIDSQIIDLNNITEIKNHLPTMKNNSNQTSENSFDTNYYNVKIYHESKSSYLIIGVLSLKKSTIVLQSTFYSYKNIIEPNPSSEQLFHINGDKKITLSFPLNNNYFAYIIGIKGKGIINILNSNRKYYLKGSKDSLGVAVTLETKNNFKIEISNEEYFSFYVYYEQRSDQNFDDLIYGTNGQMFYYENDLPIIYYSKVPDEEEVNFIINIKNYTIKEKSNDEINNQQFTLNGIVVSETAILEKKRDKDKNPDPSFMFPGIFDPTLNVGVLHFTKKEFDDCKINETKYLYVILNKNRENKNIYSNFETEYSVLPLNSNNYYAPYNQYYYGTFLKNSSNIYRLRKNDEKDKYIRIEFATNDPNIIYEINDKFIENESKSNENIIISKNNIFGKNIIFVELPENTNLIYFYIKENGMSVIGDFSLKYTSAQKIDDFINYVIEKTKINKSGSGSDLILTFNTIKNNKTGSFIPSKYYLRIFELSDIKNNEIISIIGLLKVKPINIYSISSNNNDTELSFTLKNFGIERSCVFNLIGITNDDSNEQLVYDLLENIIDNNKKNIWFIIIILILGIVICALIFVFYYYYRKLKRENDDLKTKVDNTDFEKNLLNKNEDV